jgi:hypothetical protein
VQGGKVMIHSLGEVLVPPSMVPEGGLGPKQPKAPLVPAPASSASGVAATMALALPLLAAALL